MSSETVKLTGGKYVGAAVVARHTCRKSGFSSGSSFAYERISSAFSSCQRDDTTSCKWLQVIIKCIY